ncbi:MAG: alpha/beta hydrolase [Solirubrobacterales bacterium]|nr:alpha/beta hydrolase [Solirubrobacterales bacterium]MBV9800252.1 alpha/beta hydrolase [Solirubrobacterales bacterium]
MPIAAPDLTPTASGERMAHVGELRLCYETFGDPAAPPLLLVMGLSAQMILWDEDFCELLAAQGVWVIRFDNRDVGRSTIVREAPVPKRWQLLTRDPRGAAYSLDDMAADVVGLLDHLEIGAAHVVGVSMGGMIAQLVAMNHPDRTLSLVSIMSTTGNRRVGYPSPRMALRLLRTVPRDRAGYIADHIETYRAIGSKGFNFEEEHKRERAGRCFDRGIHPAGSARQLAAVVTAPDRTPRLAQITVPTTVIHGDGDPLIHVSGGRATAEAIPGAKLLILPGMGHDLPRELWPQIIDAIVQNASLAAA